MAGHRADRRRECRASARRRATGERVVFPVSLLALVLVGTMPVPGSIPTVRAQDAFSAGERAIIARNASLRALLARDPALVRRILARLAAPGPRSLAPETPDGTGRNATRDLPLPGAADFDPAADPDLGALQRASPEAAHDLFQLIKQASSDAKR